MFHYRITKAGNAWGHSTILLTSLHSVSKTCRILNKDLPWHNSNMTVLGRCGLHTHSQIYQLLYFSGSRWRSKLLGATLLGPSFLRLNSLFFLPSISDVQKLLDVEFSEVAGLGSVEFIMLESKQAVTIWQMKILPCAHCAHMSNQFHALFNKASSKPSKTGDTWETLSESPAPEFRFPARHDIFIWEVKSQNKETIFSTKNQAQQTVTDIHILSSHNSVWLH